MKIVDLRTTTVTVPLGAPLCHANGTHWGRFIIKRGPFRYRNGCVALPKGLDLVGELDRDRVAEYAGHYYYHCQGGSAYDHDPTRPRRYSIFPRRNLADPAKGAIAL